jgi:hypothetical protein
MTHASECRAGRPRAVGVTALAVVLLASAGVAIQAAFVVRHARTELTAPREHRIRELLEVAGAQVPPGDRYAMTSPARTPNAVYFMGYRPVAGINLQGSPAAVHHRLAEARVQYVIVLNRGRPRAFRSRHPTGYRVVATLPAGQLLEIGR